MYTDVQVTYLCVYNNLNSFNRAIFWEYVMNLLFCCENRQSEYTEASGRTRIVAITDMPTSGGHWTAGVRPIHVPIARVSRSRIRARSAAWVTTTPVRRTTATATTTTMAHTGIFAATIRFTTTWYWTTARSRIFAIPVRIFALTRLSWSRVRSRIS